MRNSKQQPMQMNSIKTFPFSNKINAVDVYSNKFTKLSKGIAIKIIAKMKNYHKISFDGLENRYSIIIDEISAKATKFDTKSNYFPTKCKYFDKHSL